MVEEEPETVEAPHVEEKEEKSPEKEALDSLREMLIRELEMLRKELDLKAERSELSSMESWKEEVSANLASLKEEIYRLKEEDSRAFQQIKEYTDVMIQKNEELMERLDRKVDEAKLKVLKKDMSKMNKKLVSVMEETGFGEIIDVTKIPPNILEIVYDSTLKDISLALWREYGPGAERIITDTLERIRLETSGSEMFHYDGRYIKTRDVAKNIRRGMISAKQLQDTYEALLKALVEFVPAYKPKNFKAMIKLKSQEYTVDKTTALLDRVEAMEERLSRIDMMLSSAVSGLSSQAEHIKQVERDMKERLDRRISEEVAERDARMDAVEESLNRLREEYEMRLADMERMLKERDERIEHLEKRLSGESVPEAHEAGSEELEKESVEPELNEEERFVLSAISGDGVAYSRLKRSVSTLISSPLDDILESLIDKGVLREEKKGRTSKFFPATSKSTEITEDNREKTESAPEDTEERASILMDAIPDRGSTMNRLKKVLAKSMGAEEVESLVNMLVKEGRLVRTTRGRYTIYVKKEEKGGEKDA